MPQSATQRTQASPEAKRQGRDWERAWAAIWAHPSSARMLRNTPRQAPRPVIEVFPPRESHVWRDLGTLAAIIAAALIVASAL